MKNFFEKYINIKRSASTNLVNTNSVSTNLPQNFETDVNLELDHETNEGQYLQHQKAEESSKIIENIQTLFTGDFTDGKKPGILLAILLVIFASALMYWIGSSIIRWVLSWFISEPTLNTMANIGWIFWKIVCFFTIVVGIKGTIDNEKEKANQICENMAPIIYNNFNKELSAILNSTLQKHINKPWISLTTTLEKIILITTSVMTSLGLASYFVFIHLDSGSRIFGFKIPILSWIKFNFLKQRLKNKLPDPIDWITELDTGEIVLMISSFSLIVSLIFIGILIERRRNKIREIIQSEIIKGNTWSKLI